MGSYGRFAAMIITSSGLMFVLMYLNSYKPGHVFFSETRFYMTLYMGFAMTVVMLLFMWRMYPSTRINWAILNGSLIGFAVALTLVRSQATIGDESWMKAMIPHHSIAILTSERAKLVDPRVRSLADSIIAAQQREIDEMKALIAEFNGGPPATSKVDGR